MASWKEFKQSDLATNIKSLVQAIVRHGTWQPHRQRLFPFLGAYLVTMSIEWIPSSDLSQNTKLHSPYNMPILYMSCH